jgi:N-acetyl-anhydromuramyl-L-alanine amidase AmpD
VGNFENARPTIKQRISLIKLIKKLSKKYNIPQQNVMGHGDTPHSEIEWDASKLSVRFLGGRHEQRVCPGKFFPMNYIIRKVYGRLDKRRRRYTD